MVAPQPFFTERGTPIAVRLLATTLVDMGHRVDLLVYPYGENIGAPGLRILRCPGLPFIREMPIGFSWKKAATDLLLVYSMLRYARPARYDVVHAVEESVFPALALRQYHGARVVYDMDSSLAEQLAARGPSWARLRPVFEALERWALRRADQVIAVSEALARKARAVRRARQVHVLPDIPVAYTRDTCTVEDLRVLAGPGGRIALYVGNLESYQGIDLMVETAALLPEDARVTIIVIGGDGEALESYRECARRRGIEKRLRFVGRRPLAQLGKLLAQADVLLSPRITGGNTPLKIYSYMAARRPILATRLDTHTQVLDSSTAELVPPEPEAFAGGLLRLLEDEARAARLAAAAHAEVKRKYGRKAYERRAAAAYDAL